MNFEVRVWMSPICEFAGLTRLLSVGSLHLSDAKPLKSIFTSCRFQRGNKDLQDFSKSASCILIPSDVWSLGRPAD